jgi:Tfp pilus assembly protein PilF
MANLSVEQAFMKIKSHVKKDEIIEATKLYQVILQAFPKNLRAHQGLTALNKTRQNNDAQNPPQEVIDQLVNLYNQKQFSVVVEQAHALTEQYPKAFVVWNIMGASTAQIGNLDKAIDSYNKALSLKPDYAEAYSNMGLALQDQGNLDKAIDSYNKALSLKPDYAEAYNNMGVALQDQGNLDKAIESYNKALSLKPDYPKAYNNMGLALQDQGKHDEAIEVYNKALSLKPDYAEAYNNMGLALQDQGKLDKAIESYNKALSLKPDYAEAYSNMGVALQDQGKLDKAIESYNKALSLEPDYAEAYSNMGVALQDQGKLDKAIESYNKALSLEPDYAKAYNNMGVALQDQGKHDEAIEVYNKALSLKPDYAEAYNNMGLALQDQGKLDKAIESYNKALSLKPDYAEAYSNMGVALQDQGKLDKAIEVYNKALSLKPDYAEAHLNLSLTLLNSGKLQEGLDEYEWRWGTPKFLQQKRNFVQSMWDGKQSLHGKTILIWCEQGVGDTITWSSCLPFIVSQAKHCILECQPKLVPLLKRSFPNIKVKAEDRSSDLQRDDFDLHLPMGSLYKNLSREIFQNTKVDAYLEPDPVRVNFWKERLNSLGNGPYIGISWKSIVMTPGRIPNYAPILEWSPLLTLPDVKLINLQPKDFEEDLNKIRHELGVTVHNFDDIDHWDDLDDVAALCTALDMVVSNKITVPLIAAGVGTSTKLANWKQSAWNNILLNPRGPYIDIFERDTYDPWDRVFNLIADDILKLYENRSSS